MIELRMPSVVEEWYREDISHFITKWKIEGKEYKNEALQYFYTISMAGVGTALWPCFYIHQVGIDFERYKQASESEYTANINAHRQSAEGFVKNLMCITDSPTKSIGDVYVELNSALKQADRHGVGGSLYGVKNLSDYDILKIIFVRNNSLGVKNWRGKPTYLRIVQDNVKNEKIIVTPEMKREPVKEESETGLKPRHFVVPSAFFKDRRIYDDRLTEGKETEQEVLKKLDKRIFILNQFMTNVNPKFYDTIREQLNIKYVGEEKPVDVRLQMARRRRGLEAEGITTNPLLWAGATVLTLLTLFKRS